MSARRIAWMPLVVLLGEFAAYAFLTTRASRAGVGLAHTDLPVATVIIVASVVMSAFGCFLASRRPHNAIGWLFAVIPCGFWIKGMTDAITYYAHFDRHGAVPGGVVAAWMSSWDFIPAVGALGSFVLLLFPDGHLPSRRWRPAAWFAGAAIVVVVLATAFVPGPLTSFTSITNPFRAPGPIASLPNSARAIVLLLPISFLVAVASLVARVRAGTPILRQQVKWVGYAGVLFALGFASTSVIGFHVGGAIAVFGPVCALPVASVIAILRYRLYDIDRLISRTLTYTLVTALVAGVYVLVVLVPTASFGQGRTPSWLIAVGTIVAAAAFRPIRRRVQNAIDRRFNRARYDASGAIEAFAARLRNETDINELTTELEALVRQTMEPAHVSLWLHGPTT